MQFNLLNARYLVKLLEALSNLIEKDESILEIITTEFCKSLKNEIAKNITACNLNYASKIFKSLTLLPYDESFDKEIYKSI